METDMPHVIHSEPFRIHWQQWVFLGAGLLLAVFSYYLYLRGW